MVATVIRGSYEWDDAKAADNVQKHGVSFDEAVTVLADPNVAIVEAASESDEDRYAAIGFSFAARLLYVVHVERAPRDRIVSARRATAEEERTYNGEMNP
jgi:uncharacterized DUF497 family protein